MSVKGQLGNFPSEADKTLDNYVYQRNLRNYFMDIRKVRDDMQKNREEVENSNYMDEVTRRSLGGIYFLASLLLVLWRFRGKIRHLQAMRPQTNFSLQMVHQQPPTFPLPIAQTIEVGRGENNREFDYNSRMDRKYSKHVKRFFISNYIFVFPPLMVSPSCWDD